MYLKRVELQGFKSFADKTDIEFDKNITSIVGPNGSGKSNIADAIRWVLGEQSMKNLRGSKLEDIIFSGTSARKRMGFAEVSLILDNNQKMIDLDYTEITVSRRIFRNSNSEYFINMVPCRLKDIHEMFYDTGVGRTGYSVVGQGKIDEIISSRSEDRREVFEEASGIIKYKIRKQESERKLEHTEQNLLRIQDIVSELELQLEPLSIQAEKAKKYLALRDDLKTSEINLYVHNINRLKRRYKKLDENLLEKEEVIQARRKELNQLIEKEKLRLETTKELDIKIKTANEEYHELRSEIDRINAEMALVEERKNNISENIERYTADIEKLINTRGTILSDVDKKKARIKYLEDQRVQFETKLSEYEIKYNEFIKNLGEEDAGIDKLKDLVMDKMDLLSDKKNQFSNTKAYIDSIVRRREEVKVEIVSSYSEKDLLHNNKNEINNKVNKIDNEIKQQITILEEKGKLQQSRRLEVERSETNNLKLLNEINYSSTRLKALKAMEESHEGYNKSVKEIIKNMQIDKTFAQGIHGPLAKLIEVPKEYSIPVEISLGSVLQNIVTDDEYAAKKAIVYLKDNQIGRATFLPITSLKAIYIHDKAKSRLKELKGFLTIASDIVKCDHQYREIIDSFLSRTLIVETLDDAISISRKMKNEYRIVTLEGDLINRGGAITGGSLKGRASNLLMRGAEIEEISKQIDSLNNVYTSKKQKTETDKKELISIESELKEIETQINTLRIDLVKEQGNLKRVNETIDRIVSRVDMFKNERLQLEKEQEKNEKDSKVFSEEITKIETEIEECKKDIEERSSKQKERQSDRDILHQDITDYKISVNSVLESISNLKENLESLEKENINIDDEIKKIQEMIEKGRRYIQQNTDKTGIYTIELSNTKQRLIGKETHINRLEQEKEGLEESMQESYIAKEKIENDIENLKNDKNKVEIRKVKCEAEIDTIKNRLWDEYELTFGNCEKTAMLVENAQKIQKDIEELRNSIKELGDVNVNAIDDFIKTKERHEFLNIQHEDMIKAGEDLRKVIKEMEIIMKKQFIEQFQKINELFNQVFKDLFLGGTATLTLVDETDILKSPIDINVQPPGKKLQNMMLLSSGEKAFTAIALLFAIIKLKDTPFCILDEIDAALDDPNVVRFSDYLQELTQRTQFILVTHRKGTMEASDVLYGVTSQEKGVSKIVSLNMNS